MGWLTDLFRLFWGLLYWNARKALYRRAPKRRRCPCQAPSDSGRAFDTVCEASLTWNEPGRFRRVCPALVRRGDGWRCSLDAADVRPYWGRACLLLSLAVALSWGSLSLGTYAFLRHRGFPVAYMDIAWPLRWDRIALARAAYFRQLGFAALQRGQLREASIHLHIAWSFDPGHNETALVLARLAALNNTDLSDGVSRHLLEKQRELPEAVAQGWLGLLLARGDFPSIRTLAIERLRGGRSDTASAWLHALLTATRLLRDEASLASLAADPQFAVWRPVFETELLHRRGRTDEAVARLSQAWRPPQVYFAFYQTQLLLRLRQPAAALDVLAIYEGLLPLPERDRISLWLGAWAALGRNERLQQAAAELIGPNTPPSSLVLLANHLIAHPDARLAATVWARLQRFPLPATEDAIQAYNAFFCSCAISENTSALNAVREEIHRRTGARFIALDYAEDYFRKHGKNMKINTFLPMLPLPTTSLYALHEAVAR